MDPAGWLNGKLRRVPGWVVYPAALIPLGFLVWRAATDGLGPDPVKALEHQLGTYGLQLLLAGLLVTPIRRWTGVNLIRYRRAVGLMAFLYVALHLMTWVLLDMHLRWAEIGADLVKRPYIIVGMAGFLALVPLAITSNNASIRRLGPKGWQRLHRLTYVAVLLGAAHYLMLVKAWPREPVLYALAAVFLVGLRLWWQRARVAPTGARRA